MHAVTLNSIEQLDSLIASKPWVLVDFWASWCGPCQIMGPVVDRLAERYSGRLIAAKANVDELRSVAGRFGVRNIPTLILFHGGQPVDRMIGVHGETVLDQWLEGHWAAEARV